MTESLVCSPYNCLASLLWSRKNAPMLLLWPGRATEKKNFSVNISSKWRISWGLFMKNKALCMPLSINTKTRRWTQLLLCGLLHWVFSPGPFEINQIVNISETALWLYFLQIQFFKIATRIICTNSVVREWGLHIRVQIQAKTLDNGMQLPTATWLQYTDV